MFDPSDLVINYERLRRDEEYRSSLFDQLVSRYYVDINKYCAAFFGETQGEEITQEVFLAAWKSLPKFRGDAAIRTWLFGIARNKCLQALRNLGRRKKLLERFCEDIRIFVHRNLTTTPEEAAQTMDQQVKLAKAIDKLNDYDRVLFNLRYTSELTIDEIAELTKISTVEIQRKLMHIRNHLRELLEHDVD